MISRRHFMLAGGAALGGCGVIPKVNDPIPLYTLSAVTAVRPSLPKVDWQLVVGTPVASADLDTTRIALDPLARRRRVFRQGRLGRQRADPAAGQADRELRGLRTPSSRSGATRSACGPTTCCNPTCAISRPSLPARRRPRICAWLAKLVRMPDRRIVANIAIEQKVPAGGGSLPQIVDAFDRAAERSVSKKWS